MAEEKSRILIAINGSQSLSLESILTSMGYQLFISHNPAETLEKARLKPGIIILSTGSPELDVIGILGQLKQSEMTRNIPVIVMTAAEEAETRLKALEKGADEFLTGAIDKTELQVRLTSVGNMRVYREQQLHFQKNFDDEVNRRTDTFKQAFEKIKVASLDTIFRLSRAAEYKDTDTGAHIERMSHYSTAIARQMKLDESFIEHMLYASPMHDIGKIGIPDAVLQKPGKLDDAEWEIMRRHTTIGAEILKDSKVEFMQLAEEIAIAHHEKWDGTGYPNKVKGTDIPLSARIVAMADVFDALTSERPYKKPMELEKALSIITEGKGTHFDPDVVDSFLAIKDEIAASLGWWKFMDSDEDSLFKE